MTSIPGMDVGVADLIHQGKVVIKQGVEISALTPSSVIFTDNSEHDADVIIYACVLSSNLFTTPCSDTTDYRTGYHSRLESLKPVFGEEVIAKTPSIWGFDEEQELNGCYRPSGQPGVSIFDDSWAVYTPAGILTFATFSCGTAQETFAPRGFIRSSWYVAFSPILVEAERLHLTLFYCSQLPRLSRSRQYNLGI